MKRILLAAALAIGFVSAAQAQTVTMIVPTSAGGGLDTVARIVALGLQEKSKKTYVVDNRGGANGMIGAKAAAAARPDGNTWLMTDSALLTVNPALYPADPHFDPYKDLQLVGAVGQQTSVLVVNPRKIQGDIKDFVELARREEVPYASGGIGSAGHLTMASFGDAMGLKLLHVPYKGGGPAMADMVGGQIGAAFVATSVAIPHIRSGALVPLAVASRQRLKNLPDVPTVAEKFKSSFEVSTAFMIFLPAKTPAAQVAQARQDLKAVLADTAVQDKIRAAGMEPAADESPDAILKWAANERAKWTELVNKKVISMQ